MECFRRMWVSWMLFIFWFVAQAENNAFVKSLNVSYAH